MIMKMSSKALKARGFDVPDEIKEPPNDVRYSEQSKEIVQNVEPIIVPMESPGIDRIEQILLQLFTHLKNNNNKPVINSGVNKKPSGMTMNVKRDKYGFIENATFDFNYEDK